MSEPGRESSGAPPSAGGRVALVDGARLPLAFIGFGLVALAAAVAGTAALALAEARPYLHPHWVGVAHLWLPGFLLSICLGASYQLMPVVLGVPLRAGAFSLWAHLAAHAGGTAALAAGLAGGRYVLAGLGGAAVLGGLVRFSVVTFATFAASRRRDVAAWSFPWATLWLLATAAAGLLLAANRHAPFLPLPAVGLLQAHAHLGLVGYFLSLLQGVTFQLVPMFTMGAAARPRHALAGLLATQVALPVLAGGLAWDWTPATRLGVMGVGVGLVASASAFVATLRSRRRRVLDPGVRAFVVGLALLALAAAGGVVLVFGGAAARPLEAAWTYGFLAVGGGLTLAVGGMLCKILPFLVWMKAYGPRVGREPVPAATALASRKLEYAWLGLHLAGLAALAGGTLWAWPAARAIGGLALAAGAACYLANAVRVARHLRRGPSARRRRETKAAAEALLSSL